jgi:hypothetical protein
LTLRDAQEHVEPPRSTFKESKPQRKRFQMALMSSILDSEPSSIQKAIDQQVWRYAMLEYTSIMKNDAWDIVSRPNEKPVGSSRQLYKIKMLRAH